METMLNIVAQETIEKRFNRKHIDAKLRKFIEADADLQEAIDHGVELIEQWMQCDYYESKNRRLEQLKDMDMRALVTELFIGIAYVLREELFTSVTAQLASRLGFNDKTEAITTVSELIAVLCETDVFDINKAERSASLMILSGINLPDDLVQFIEESQFLPPMVCEPLELTHNFSSGYLTHNSSLILGSGNHHDGDLCLDVLNLCNSVPLQLDTQFLSTVEENPTFALDDQDKVEDWKRFKEHSYMFYELMANNGNRFHFTHNPDKRGRLYCHGYHLSTQGTAFKKAMIEFAEEELVEGVN
jgi:hypothetical protein